MLQDCTNSFTTTSSFNDVTICQYTFKLQAASYLATVSGLRNYAVRPVRPRRAPRGSLMPFFKEIFKSLKCDVRASTRRMPQRPDSLSGRKHSPSIGQEPDRYRRQRPISACQTQMQKIAFLEVGGVFLPGPTHLANRCLNPSGLKLQMAQELGSK